MDSAVGKSRMLNLGKSDQVNVILGWLKKIHMQRNSVRFILPRAIAFILSIIKMGSHENIIY